MASSTLVPRRKNELSTPWWTTPYAEDLGAVLWSNSKYKDFQIIIGDRVLGVHKCVLAARSPVFATMLTSGLTETQSGQVKIQDFDFETVEKAIWILYNHLFVTNYSTPVICDLLRFGQKYDIGHLINACLRQIQSLKDSYDSSEKEFLIKSAESLGSDRILDLIKTIILERKFGDYYFSCFLTGIGYALFQVDSFKDLKIICDGGTEFALNKCILSLKSPIFAQKIENMAENEDRLIIDGISPGVFGKAIEFLYRGHILTPTNFGQDLAFILELLGFADKFRVEGLARFCLQIISDQSKHYEINREIMSTWIATCGNFESKKIFHSILGIFGTRGFDPFDFKKDSNESYWN